MISGGICRYLLRYSTVFAAQGGLKLGHLTKTKPFIILAITLKRVTS